MWSLVRRRKECIVLPDVPVRIEISQINPDSVVLEIDGPSRLKVVSDQVPRASTEAGPDHSTDPWSGLPASVRQRLRLADSSLRLFARQIEAGLSEDAEDTLQQAIWELQTLDRELVSHSDIPASHQRAAAAM